MEDSHAQQQLSNLPFHNTALCNNLITAYFQEFTYTFLDNYEILATDASKSLNFTAIAGCSSIAHFRYRINHLNSVFTAEALAIGTAIDELAWSGHPFLLLSDSLSVLKALQEVTRSSLKVILWLHQKALQASTRTSSIYLVWVPRVSL